MRDDARSDLFYVLENGPSSDDKKLLIVSRQGNKDSVIGKTQDFQNEQLGNSLKDEGKIRIDRQTASNPFSAQNNGQPTASQALSIEEHFGQDLKVFLNKPAHAGGTVKLTLSALGDQFEAVADGDRTGFDNGDFVPTDLYPELPDIQAGLVFYDEDHGGSHIAAVHLCHQR